MRPVSFAKTSYYWLRRQYRRNEIFWHRLAFHIALRRPNLQRVLPDEACAAVQLHEATIGQRAQRRLICDLFPLPVDSRRMQFQVHFIGEGRVSLSMRALPSVLERVEPFPPALRTRSMPGGKCDGLIQEEQLCIPILGHYHPVASPEFQDTGDPAPALIWADDLFVAVVQGAAPVAQHGSARGRPKDVAERVDAIIEWHSNMYLMRFFLILISWCASALLAAQGLSNEEAEAARLIDKDAPAAIELLEKIVDINSGTYNMPGVIAVDKVLEPEFQALGFTTHWVNMDSVQRAPSLVAERKGNRGKRILLIGHTDTVFEPSSPFQRFERQGDRALAPGGSDMKGGVVILLSALKALHAVGALENSNVTVFLTGDEESAGEPTKISRKEFIEAGQNADAALCFEAGVRQGGKDYVSTARRGAASWELAVKARSGHSGGIFTESAGDGAIFELSRILAAFHDTLREPNMTYSVGLVLGGEGVKVDAGGNGSVSGKTNVIPDDALARGDIRALTFEVRWRAAGRDQVQVVHHPGAGRQLPRRTGPRRPQGPGVRPGQPASRGVGRAGAGDRDLVPARGRVRGDEMAAPGRALAGQPGRRAGHRHARADPGRARAAAGRSAARRLVPARLQPRPRAPRPDPATARVAGLGWSRRHCPSPGSATRACSGRRWMR